jgi:hypothetical protein
LCLCFNLNVAQIKISKTNTVKDSQLSLFSENGFSFLLFNVEVDVDAAKDKDDLNLDSSEQCNCSTSFQKKTKSELRRFWHTKRLRH